MKKNPEAFGKKAHNKKRNSALLYEFLIRHISNCLVTERADEAKKALEMSKVYFAKNTILNEELKLFKLLLNTNIHSRQSAQKIIEEVYSLSKKIDARKLDVEKSRLIKEINHNFGKSDFYSYKILDYPIYASIQTLLTEERNKKKRLLSLDKIKLEDRIVEHLITKKTPIMDNDAFKVNPEYNNVVSHFVVERFHKKYNNRLTENQKKMVVDYAIYLISIVLIYRYEFKRYKKNNEHKEKGYAMRAKCFADGLSLDIPGSINS